jgi:Leucine-rich repeat (LRR) protein
VLPEGISKLTALTELDLRSCTSLKSIPEFIWGLPSLEDLDLSECNGLDSLANVTFENVSSNLIWLNLSGCEKLEVLPEGISKLTSLKQLDLRFCTSLERIPESIRGFPSLEVLYVDVMFENVYRNEEEDKDDDK